MHLFELAVDKLAPIQRTAFMLREVESLSAAETAAKVRLHRARLSLRDALTGTVGQSAPQAFSVLAARCNRVVATVMAAIERGEV
jgi:RNA polymerase sigma-70 factor (ECF subfamily)